MAVNVAVEVLPSLMCFTMLFVLGFIYDAWRGPSHAGHQNPSLCDLPERCHTNISYTDEIMCCVRGEANILDTVAAFRDMRMLVVNISA